MSRIMLEVPEELVDAIPPLHGMAIDGYLVEGLVRDRLHNLGYELLHISECSEKPKAEELHALAVTLEQLAVAAEKASDG